MHQRAGQYQLNACFFTIAHVETKHYHAGRYYQSDIAIIIIIINSPFGPLLGI